MAATSSAGGQLPWWPRACQKQIRRTRPAPRRRCGRARSTCPRDVHPCCCGPRRTAALSGAATCRATSRSRTARLMFAALAVGDQPHRAACSRARTCWPPPAPCAPWASSSSASRTAAGGSRGVGVGGLAEPGGRARPRQRRHRRPPADGPPGRPAASPACSPATPRCAAGRCAASSSRSASWAPRSPPAPAAGCRSALTGRPAAAPIDYASPVASAQVKSAVLLAGLHAPGTHDGASSPCPRATTPSACCAAMGARGRGRGSAGRRPARAIGPRPAASLRPQSFVVPGDPSSAAFPTVAAADHAGLRACASAGVGLNPLRTGLYTTLREMGADIRRRRTSASPAASRWPIS